MASKAAKAAAAMARHGSLSREQSNVSSKSYSSRDSPRKHDMEDVSSKPESHNTYSMQTKTTSNAKGPQAGPFKPIPDSSPIAPPSPSHLSASSSGNEELHEVTPSPFFHESPDYWKEGSLSKQKMAVKKEEEYGYSDFNVGYNHSNCRGSTSVQGVAIWDDNRNEEDSEVVSSNIQFDSCGPTFGDSRSETYDRPVYEEDPFFQFERNKSSASRGGTTWFSDNFPSAKLPKIDSSHKDSSSLFYTSNTDDRDPPRSPADTGSATKFDKGPRSPGSSSLVKDDNSSPLDILSWGRQPQSHFDEDVGPRFDIGPNFDSDVHFDDENDKLNLGDVHEEEKVVEEEYFAGSSLSSFPSAKGRRKDSSVSSSDESRTNKLPLSMRTRDSRTKPTENITKEPSAKPLQYIPKDNKSDDEDESGSQELLNYGNLTGGRRNKSGYTRPPYTVKPLAEESKPSNRPASIKPAADLSVEEERLYAPSRLTNKESEVKRNSPFGGTTYGDKTSERKEATRKTTLRYIPNRRISDDEEEEIGGEEVIPARIKVKVPGASRLSDYHNLGDEETKEEVAKPAKIKLKETSSSRVSKGNLGLGANELVDQEPVKVSRRVVGGISRDSIQKHTTREEELEVRKDESTERTKKEVPSKSGEKSRSQRRPLVYVPSREDSDEEEQVRTVPPPKESTKSPPREGNKEKVNKKEKQKEEVVDQEEKTGAPPTFPRASFPLDMEALKARVQQIRANMNN